MIEYNLPEKFYFRYKTTNRRYLAILDEGGNYDIMDANNILRPGEYVFAFAQRSLGEIHAAGGCGHCTKAAHPHEC